MLKTLFEDIILESSNALEEADKIYAKILKVFFVAVPLYVLVLWLLNIVGLQMVISIIFIFVLMLMVAVGFAPRALLTAVGLGILAKKLNNGDVMTGAKEGMTSWYKLMLNATFYVLLMTWWLMIYPYQNAPLNFFPFAALGLMILVVSLKLNKGGNLLPLFVSLVSLAGMIYISITTLDDGWFSRQSSDGAGQASGFNSPDIRVFAGEYSAPVTNIRGTCLRFTEVNRSGTIQQDFAEFRRDGIWSASFANQNDAMRIHVVGSPGAFVEYKVTRTTGRCAT